MQRLAEPWPPSDEELVDLQEQLAAMAEAAVAQDPWRPRTDALVGGCFVAFARGEAGPGHPGDRAWAGAVTWRPPSGGRPAGVVAEVVVADRVPAAYAPGLLARREGPVLAACLAALRPAPAVVLVDATGRDHPRRAGLALHLGAALGLPTVGVTHRGLVLRDPPPPPGRRGDVTVAELGGQPVAAWVCTRSGARPLLVHPAWRTDLASATEVVLAASSEEARTPAPLQQARRAARQARAAAGAGRP